MKRVAGTGLLYVGASWISHDYNPLNWGVLTILFSNHDRVWYLVH